MTNNEPPHPAPDPDHLAESTPTPPAEPDTADLEERLVDEEWAQHEPATPTPEE